MSVQNVYKIPVVKVSIFTLSINTQQETNLCLFRMFIRSYTGVGTKASCVLGVLDLKFSRIKSHHLVKFGGHSSGGIGNTFFICHVSWYIHVMNRLCGFANSILSSEATSLSSLVAIGLVEVEI